MVEPDRCRQFHLSPDSFQHSTTSVPRKEKRGFSAGENREKISTIVSTRILRPVAS